METTKDADAAGPTGSLDLGGELPRARLQWRLERVAWIAFTLLLCAIGLGGVGRGGPLSTVVQDAMGGRLRLEYDRFLRSHSPDRLRLEITPASTTTRVAVAHCYLDRIDIERVTPEPSSVTAREHGIEYLFETDAGKRTQVTLHLVPQRIGMATGWVALDRGPPVSIRHWVHP